MQGALLRRAQPLPYVAERGAVPTGGKELSIEEDAMTDSLLNRAQAIGDVLYSTDGLSFACQQFPADPAGARPVQLLFRPSAMVGDSAAPFPGQLAQLASAGAVSTSIQWPAEAAFEVQGRLGNHRQERIC